MSLFSMNRAISLILAVALAGCLPTNHSRKNSSSHSLNDSSMGISDPNESEVARGQCSLIDPSSPERSICITCYDSILNSRCPGKSDPSQCVDPSVIQNFTNLVNQCISTSIIAGFPCTKTCPSGQSLEASSCTCISSSGGTSGGGTGPIDSGQTTYGPPIVNAYWPLNVQNKLPLALGSCRAKMTPINLLVQNRGSTVPLANSYNALNANCKIGNSPIAGKVTSVTPPSPSANNYVATDFTADTEGIGAYNIYPYRDFQVGLGAGWSVPAGQGALTLNNSAALTRFLGTLGSSRADGQGNPIPDQAILTLNNIAAGDYLLTFDLYLIDEWRGDASGHQFKVSLADGVTSTLFKQSFANQSGLPQTYGGVATKRGFDLGFTPPLAGSELYTDSIYRLNITFRHSCAGGAPSCNLALNFAGVGLPPNSPGSPSWGLDNIGIAAVPYCGITYTFRDSNQETSTYCMKFKIYNSCGQLANNSATAASGCDCFALPFSTVANPYFSPVKPTDTCP